MLQNRFPVLIDACVLVGAMKRNILLSFAAAGLFRVRWTKELLDEVEKAVREIMEANEDPLSLRKAQRCRAAMEKAFPEARVKNYNKFLSSVTDLPDPDDWHVLAAALKAQVVLIVTENISHFPAEVLDQFNIEAMTSDQFIASTIDLNPENAVAALRELRQRLRNPAFGQSGFLQRMRDIGLQETSTLLEPHKDNL